MTPACSIPELLARQCAAQPRAPAIRGFDRPPLTYADLTREVARCIERLAGLGVRHGERVVLLVSDGPALAVACLAVSSGAVAVPLHARSRPAELQVRLAALGASAIIVGTDVEPAARRAACLSGLNVLTLVPRPGALSGTFDLEGSSRGVSHSAELSGPGDTAVLLQTSGTTGVPKLIPLTHDQLCVSAHNVAASLALSPRDHGLGVMPLVHVHGLVGSLLASLAAGSLVTCAPGFSALAFLAWITQARPSWYTAVPAMHRAILRILETADAEFFSYARANLRLIRSASAPLPPVLMAELEHALGVPVIEAYGMTEAAHQIASNPLPPRLRTPGSVGVPVGVEVAILDQTGDSVATGRVGEVAIRGRTVVAALEGRASRPTHETGWLRSGDEGYLDEDGYLFLTGRLSDFINRGGEKISPVEVDAVLTGHPAVVDAITVPVPHPELGEEVGAFVALREGEHSSC